MNDWKLVKRKIGWTHTIREGWAIESDNPGHDCYGIYAWIENDCLAICDLDNYYSTGHYDIPLNMIQLLKDKTNEQSTKTSLD